jgi:hypothetical protein
VTASKQNGHGNGNGAGKSGGGPGKDSDPIDDFDALIRDRDDDFEIEFDDPFSVRSHPRGDYDPYSDFESARAYGTGGHYGAGGAGFSDRGLADALTRIIEMLGGVDSSALSPEARRQLEKTLRDLLVLLRDVLNRIIESIDARSDDDFEIEEIPID